MTRMQSALAANLRTASANPNGTFRQHVALQLAMLILAQKRFRTVAALRKFCTDPDNLRAWLPSDADRINLARELCAFLRTISIC